MTSILRSSDSAAPDEETDAAVLIARIMESGDALQVRWMLHRYGRNRVASVARDPGAVPYRCAVAWSGMLGDMDSPAPRMVRRRAPHILPGDSRSAFTPDMSFALARLDNCVGDYGLHLFGESALIAHLRHRSAHSLELACAHDSDLLELARALAKCYVSVGINDAGDSLGLQFTGANVQIRRLARRFVGDSASMDFELPATTLVDAIGEKLQGLEEAEARRIDLIDLYQAERGGVSLEHVLGAWAAAVPEARMPDSMALAKYLAFVEGADQEPDPELLIPCDWRVVRAWAIRRSRLMLERVALGQGVVSGPATSATSAASAVNGIKVFYGNSGV